MREPEDGRRDPSPRLFRRHLDQLDVCAEGRRCGHRFTILTLHALAPALGKDINPIQALPVLLSFCLPSRVNFEPPTGWNDTDMERHLTLKRLQCPTNFRFLK